MYEPLPVKRGENTMTEETFERRESLYFSTEYILYEPAQACTVHHIR
jgi:hypothetical protein